MNLNGSVINQLMLQDQSIYVHLCSNGCVVTLKKAKLQV